MCRGLDLVRAELMPDDRPDHVVRLHGGEEKKLLTNARDSPHVRATADRSLYPVAIGARGLQPRSTACRECARQRSEAFRATAP